MNPKGLAPHSNIGASPEEAERFLAAHPEIAGVDLILTDPGGVMRGKNIRREELMAIYRHGRYMPGSILR